MDKGITKEARRLALVYANKGRQEAGKPPIRSVGSLWWSMFGKEWLEVAQRNEGKPESEKLKAPDNGRWSDYET